VAEAEAYKYAIDWLVDFKSLFNWAKDHIRGGIFATVGSLLTGCAALLCGRKRAVTAEAAAHIQRVDSVFDRSRPTLETRTSKFNLLGELRQKRSLISALDLQLPAKGTFAMPPKEQLEAIAREREDMAQLRRQVSIRRDAITDELIFPVSRAPAPGPAASAPPAQKLAERR
jgi:hypothetical protein